jgi:hypothetical protein
MSTVQIVAGFSLTNRLLLYASLALSPAQFLSGWGSHCPTNLGFLAYNVYTQVQWYRSVQAKQLHAISLVPVHYNTICAITYLGGITSGNIPMALLLGLGSAALMYLNNISGWTSWATNQAEGFGTYRFFFFGWRTLTPGWHKFFLVWQISDSLETVTLAGVAIVGAVAAALSGGRKKGVDDDDGAKWWWTYPMVVIGSIIMLLLFWEFIFWMEMVVHGNHIESETDWIAVWLFIGQAVTMIVPTFGW